jgi:sugar transferase (PEP-CTERM/EpsH1 system associated)
MNILFLCHRIPFPPDKGDKIRAYHMLAHLAKEHTVHLGTFVDDRADMRHAETLRRMIRGECLLVPLGAAARMKMAAAFARGAPLSASYFASGRLARWVDQILRKHNIGRAIVFSTAMAPYLLARRDFDPARVIFDMVDVDSDKWRQYAGAAKGLRAWIYRREMRTLLALERNAAFAFGATLLVSRHETETFAQLAPESCVRLHSVPNGVDLEFFRPDRVYPNPFGANEMPIVMTGTMDYRPNTEGAIWLAQSVLPLICAARPEARLYVVGARPSASVKSLAASNVVITGKVDDVRPYLAHAGVVVAPLKLARGLQNKVLEGMAMARPVIATSPAVQALNVSSGKELWIADEPADFAQTVIGALGGPAAIAVNGRHYVEQNHDWTRNLAALDCLLDAGPRMQTSRASVGGPVLPLARAAE